MSLEPAKSAIIDFSNKRDRTKFNISMDNKTIPWVDNIKILGITFSYNLSFREHFRLAGGKALKRLNYLKALGGTFWGASKTHIARLANTCVLSILDFGTHITSFAGKTDFGRIEKILNQVTRFTTGLPRWTPIPVLRAEAGVGSARERSDRISLSFLFKQLALSGQTPTKEAIKGVESQVSTAVFNRLPYGLLLSKFTGKHAICTDNIIPFTHPSQVTHSHNLVIFANELPFQCHGNSCPPAEIQKKFQDYRRSNWESRIIIATDCSKSVDGVAVAIVNATTKSTQTGKIHNLNSAFTGEVCAIIIAIQKEITDASKEYVICTDSLSTLQALHNVSRKSPTPILQLSNVIAKKLLHCVSLTLVWVPAHVGIDINEQADTAAKNALCSTITTQWVNHKDLQNQTKRDEKATIQTAWTCSKYALGFSHLSANKPTQPISLTRAEDSLLSRLRTRSLPTKYVLCKVNLDQSPTCQTCNTPDTNDHVLLTCTKYDQPRNELRRALGTIPMSYNWICLMSTSNRKIAKSVAKFLLATNI